ncbi:MAG: pseudouridine synthase [Bacteroidales bacterium]|nr:pseudouridine synthase [Bacteroidales bacterium]
MIRSTNTKKTGRKPSPKAASARRPSSRAQSRGTSAPRRSDSDAPKRTYTRRSDSEAPKRSYSRRSDSEAPKRSYSRRSDSEAPKRSYSRRSDSEAPKRSYSRRSDSEAPKRSYSRRSDSEAPKRTYTRRSDSEAPRRTYSRRSDSEAPKRTYTRRSDSEAPRRTYSRRSDSEAPVKSTRVKRTRSDFENVRSQLEGRETIAGARKPRAEAYTPKPRKPKAKDEEGIRLNRFIANSGVCSRREADEYIVQGIITVNGQVVTELGTKVFRTDQVRMDGQLLQGEEKVYILMNKPKNCVTTTDDELDRKTVLDLVAGKCPQRVYPVGRLDRDTTGVLLLTNDGELTEKLTHPSFNKKKIYHVFLDSNLSQGDFDKILKGIRLDDGMISADALSYIDGDQSQVGIEIHSGRNRIVRRIFESLGYKVVKLDRVYFAGLTKKNLRRGQWRFLTEKEIGILKMGSYE